MDDVIRASTCGTVPERSLAPTERERHRFALSNPLTAGDLALVLLWPVLRVTSEKGT